MTDPFLRSWYAEKDVVWFHADKRTNNVSFEILCQVRDSKIQAFDLDEQSDTVSAKSVSVSSHYDDYGCFYHDKDESTFISKPLSTMGGSVDQKGQECNDVCDTKHFAISSSMCFCYVEAPKQRLAIGSCNSVSDTNIK